MVGRGFTRGLGILAIAAEANASTLITFLIQPALGHAYPFDSESDDALYDWRLDTPLIPSLISAPSGSVEQKYFELVLLFFAAAFVCVALTPRGGALAMVAVGAVILAAAFTGVRNVPMAVIAIVPVFANHPGLLLR